MDKKLASAGAVKRVVELTKPVINDHEARLTAMENSSEHTLTCENTITKIPDNVMNNLKLTSVQGKTLQNAIRYMDDTAYEHTSGNNFEFIGDGYVRFDRYLFINKGVLNVKPSTVYTLILDVTENTFKSELVVGGAETNNFFNRGFTVVNIGQTGIIKKVINSISDFSVVTGTSGIRLAKSGSVPDGTEWMTARVMILEGDWTNKEVPPYFEGIQSVQNPLDVQVTGKNLFDKYKYTDPDAYDYIYDTANYRVVKIQLKPFTTYTTNVIRKNGFTGTIGGTVLLCNHRSGYLGSYTSIVNSSYPQYTSRVYTTDRTGCMYLSFGTTVTKDSLKTIWENTDVQIEVGNTATAYEPYKQPINYAIPFDGELRSLPSGIADEIKDGKLIRRINKVTLNGSEKWITSSQGTENEYFYLQEKDFPLKGVKETNNLFCNTLPTVGTFEGYQKGIRMGNSYAIMLKNRELSPDTLTQWLKDNPTTLYYECLEPEIIELDSVYNNPIYKIHENGNIIYNNTPIHPVATFAYTTGLQSTMSELHKEITQHENEIREMLVESTGEQTVTERVNDLVMQDGNIKLEEMQGNTVQNLIPNVPDSYYQQIGYYSFSGDYATVDSLNLESFPDATNATFVANFETNIFKKNTVYTLIVIENTHPLLVRDGTNSSVLSSGAAGENIITFTTLDNPMTQFQVYFQSMPVGSKCKYKNNIMVLEGDWTDKEVPAYFAGIKSVNEEQTGLQVRSVGKNLFNLKDVKSSANGNLNIISNNEIEIDNKTGLAYGYAQVVVKGVKPNVQHILSCDFETVSGSNSDVGLVYMHDDLTEEMYATSTTTTGNHRTMLVTPKSHVMRLYMYANTRDVTQHKIRFSNIQLEEGSVATDYEPYKESAITIPYAEPLRRLPNGVCDTIEDGKVIRRVGKVVYDGTNWTEHQNSNDTTLMAVLWEKVAGNRELSTETETGRGSAINDKFRTFVDHFWFVTGYPLLKVPRTQFATLDALKAWMKENPITSYYQLATPIEEELPEITLAGYKHLIFDNDIVPSSATVSYANSNYSRLVALEEANVQQAKTLSDLQAVINYLTTQVTGLTAE